MDQSIQARAHLVSRYLPREISGQVEMLLRNSPVVIVTGMRQVGKSTMLVNDPLLKDREYISLDDLALLEASNENPDSMLRSYGPLTIDEAQRSDALFLAIKRSVDRKREAGRFLLSGSASFELRKSVSESLAGRAVYLRMMPLTRRETLGGTKRKPFLLRFMESPGKRMRMDDIKPVSNKEIVAGGMPPVVLASEEEAQVWLMGYEQNYVERDIRYISRVDNIVGFRNVLRLLAARTGQILNVSQVARDAALPVKTTFRYLGWLENLFLVYRLQTYHGGRTKRVRKAPKIFVSDTGLACHLSGCTDLAGDPMRGHIVESYVAQNLLGILNSHTLAWNLYYWRNDTGLEVDFVIENKRETLAIEVKAGESWSKRDLKGLRAFLSAVPGCKAGILAYNGTEMINLGDRIWAVPMGLLLS
ncbi:MAG: ATP-binding protein [Actinobacteria bacterium]|nr:ATP-binding protein [Actinomycetota bacterium]MCG2817951.1 ATP-binding protein [Actinomycetes bacterium]MBU4178314.1 ATP-binding protein [Actinomycetota bacterium]MBU4217868.1 ATP-binding protein [Actinomycetota bacterium]MBU4357858.1 ATP-binding protein [Actinomycetota bacterium]